MDQTMRIVDQLDNLAIRASLLSNGFEMIPKSVLRRKDIGPTSKLVLAFLIGAVRSDTGECSPSMTAVAQGTGASKSSVQRALVELEEKGLVERVGEKGWGNHYLLLLPFEETKLWET